MSTPRLLAALATMAVLAGCAAIEPVRAPEFDLLGRVAVSYEGRNFSSGVRWRHQGGRDEIWLITPTGQALAHIVADAAGATLTTADRNEYHAREVEALTRRALGWELPLARMRWWVQGEAVPGVEIGEAVRDRQNRLVRLRQDGWLVTLAHHPGGGSLPQRMDLADGRQRLRLVVDSWHQDSAAAARQNP